MKLSTAILRILEKALDKLSEGFENLPDTAPARSTTAWRRSCWRWPPGCRTTTRISTRSTPARCSSRPPPRGAAGLHAGHVDQPQQPRPGRRPGEFADGKGSCRPRSRRCSAGTGTGTSHRRRHPGQPGSPLDCRPAETGNEGCGLPRQAHYTHQRISEVLGLAFETVACDDDAPDGSGCPDRNPGKRQGRHGGGHHRHNRQRLAGPPGGDPGAAGKVRLSAARRCRPRLAWPADRHQRAGGGGRGMAFRGHRRPQPGCGFRVRLVGFATKMAAPARLALHLFISPHRSFTWARSAWSARVPGPRQWPCGPPSGCCRWCRTGVRRPSSRGRAAALDLYERIQADKRLRVILKPDWTSSCGRPPVAVPPKPERAAALSGRPPANTR